MRHSIRLLLLALAVTRESPSQTINLQGSILAVRSEERTTHSGERGAPPRWQRAGEPIRFDSMQVLGGRSVLFRSRSNQSFSTTYRVWRNANGAPDSITASSERLPKSPYEIVIPGYDPERYAQQDVRDKLNELFNLAGWLIEPPARGTRTIPVKLDVRAFDAVKGMQGTMISRHLRDSVVNGLRLAIVRDSVALASTSSTPVEERTLGMRRDTRDLRGYSIGTRVYNPALRLSVYVADTTVMAGLETRLLPDRRVLRDSIRFERTSTVQFLDTAIYRRQQALASEFAFGVGMVRRPPLDAKPGLYLQHPGVVDSLVAAYQAATGPEIRDSVLAVSNLLYLPGMRERLARWHAERGDTLGALRLIDLDYSTPLTEWTWTLVRPLLDDAELAVRMGISTNEWYEAFEYEFHHYPFGTSRASPEWRNMSWCPPTVCAKVAEEFTRAREPRLSTVGLMAQYRLNPALYADTIVARANAGNRQLIALSEQAQGLSARSTIEPFISMPAAGAHWREWFVWMRGATDETVAKAIAAEAARRPAGVPTPRPRDPLYEARLSPNSNLLRIAELRWGWSLRDTFALKYEQATVDTARYVYFTLLQGLNATPQVSGDLIAQLRAPSVYDRMMTASLLAQLRFAPADTQTMREVESGILNTLLDSLPLWTQFDTTRKFYVPIGPLGRRSDVHVVADSLRPASVARLTRAGIQAHSTGWQLPNDQSGLVVTIGPIRRTGQFVTFTYLSTSLVRLTDGRGGGYASGGSCTLVFVDGRWYLLDATFWIT